MEDVYVDKNEGDEKVRPFPVNAPEKDRIRTPSNPVDDEWEGLAPDSRRPRGRRRRAATARTERLWDHAVVPFVVDSNFSGAHKALFQQVIDGLYHTVMKSE